ncbi:hypothetical protein PHSY_001708 [Pseudozyma hubeiensis SY62]|uniref:Uncharacterized protein n=1 Tax=Pseudozyma hubeiensis (strain SY62) TaxID=1305764 RepID=R9NZE2_PSEHS|nr:hypothetical protein PHSY_001708 [Pseudozyma hubeiensis SY62]GAC94139.1 hypothetical protein PHSY_001708 [Pseudozyma hubeiensis SY62]
MSTWSVDDAESYVEEEKDQKPRNEWHRVEDSKSGANKIGNAFDKGDRSGSATRRMDGGWMVDRTDDGRWMNLTTDKRTISI